jgi:hypothetical protein
MPGRKRARTDPQVVESRFDTARDERPDQADEATEKTEGALKDRSKSGAGASRSAHSIEEGGENEYRGEPPAGYYSVAPGKQNGGKR